MGIKTDFLVRTVRSTKRGSDFYGVCECCLKSCSEVFATTNRMVFVRDDGEYYLSNGGASYGHLECLIGRFGDLISENSLLRNKNAMVLPKFLVEKLNA